MILRTISLFRSIRRRLSFSLNTNHGSITVICLGLIFVLFSFVFIVIEAGAVYNNYDRVESSLRQACNIAVTGNMIDAYRADNILKLDTANAYDDALEYISENLISEHYEITDCVVECVDTPPSVEIKGNIVLSLVFNQYDFDNITIPFDVKSTNYSIAD